MRAAILIRNGSISTRSEIYGLPSANDAAVSSYRSSLCTRMTLDVRDRKGLPSPSGNLNSLGRARSDSDLIGSAYQRSCGTSWFPPGMLAEVKENDLISGVWKGVSVVAQMKGHERVQYSGGGKGKGKKGVGGNGGGGDGENNRELGVGKYYQEMLRVDPGNPIILRNYARFLHEVEGDCKKAEKYYGRAILASPGDGDVLSLYAQFIWVFQKDRQRAQIYYERAVKASPDDCCVLSSYAHFLWYAEVEEEEEGRMVSSLEFVEAF